MLIHLTPRMYACRKTQPCSLIDMKCAELGLSLKADKELTARRPYPNKNYLVACRNVGRKAMDGILIHTDDRIDEFTVVTRWAVAASHVATHRVRYVLLDNEYDTISDKMVLWYSSHTDHRDFESRWPAHLVSGTPANTQPRMEVTPSTDRCGEFRDVVTERGAIVERSEVFRLHTIQRERIIPDDRSFSERIPGIEYAFG